MGGATKGGSSPDSLHERAQSAHVEVLLAEPSAASVMPARKQRPHVLVCVRGDSLDLELIRQGRVLADLIHARLTVLHAFCLGEGEAERQALTRDRTYAVARGAVFVELPAYSPADGIVEYVQTRGVTHLVLSDTGAAPWYAAWRDALPRQLIRRLEGIDLYFVTEPAERRP